MDSKIINLCLFSNIEKQEEEQTLKRVHLVVVTGMSNTISNKPFRNYSKTWFRMGSDIGISTNEGNGGVDFKLGSIIGNKVHLGVLEDTKERG